ncbi:hypothetical protein [uncultured Nostoc sp.]|uniref:hypothetical protein n=1 Tax=uncultured Nostoc sp. TaxID=340711 RepID=UPI0035CC9030
MLNQSMNHAIASSLNSYFNYATPKDNYNIAVATEVRTILIAKSLDLTGFLLSMG